MVRFTYLGGTKAGQARLVRIEEVDDDHLKGYDLDEPDLAKAYRNYKTSRISGRIEVLN